MQQTNKQAAREARAVPYCIRRVEGTFQRGWADILPPHHRHLSTLVSVVTTINTHHHRHYCQLLYLE